jgi:hypothetical protein
MLIADDLNLVADKKMEDKQMISRFFLSVIK